MWVTTMEYIHSRDIFLLMRDTLKLVDRRAMDHGSRVAYYLFKMLECKGGYEKFELADFVFLASLHDIGAYKTEDSGDIVQYEYRNTMPHATYGYLIFKHLSPLNELASIILYHHTDYVQLEQLNYENRDIASCLNLAEKVDIFSVAMGDKFNIHMFSKQVGTVFSEEAFSLFQESISKNDVLNKVKTGEYKKELHSIIEYMIFSNADKRKYLEMLMFCQGLKSEAAVVNTVTCVCVAQSIGERIKLSKDDMEQLYYGSLLHDIGMLAVPREIIEAPRKLTTEEYQKIKMHVHVAEKILKYRMMEQIVEIVAAHHERCDGSGYPRRLRETQMNHKQQILQLADTVTALICERAYRDQLEKDDIVALLRKDAADGKYNKTIVRTFLESYDDIIQQVRTRTDEIMILYRKLNQQYKQFLSKLDNQK